mmetsp:Transcript_8099/g.21284  ORF Transcript_8099/g.21284 Transcript_8099/m.21284 type:complete len:317 (+) Transcript_8099:413-1363(+)
MSPLLRVHRLPSFSNGSIGNYFFAGARTFLCSLDAALFLYARVSRIPPDACVLPVMEVRSRDRVALGAELADGSRLHGQNTISHPPPPPSLKTWPTGEVPFSQHNLVDKEGEVPLRSPIRRVFYLANDGDYTAAADQDRPEVRHCAHPAVLQRLREAEAIVFGMGSLWTSICPCLIVSGVAEAIADDSAAASVVGEGAAGATGAAMTVGAAGRPKILMLNGSHDRETRGMDAVDVVHAIVDSLNQGRKDGRRLPPSAYVNVLLVPRGSDFAVDEAALRQMGIERIVDVASERDAKGRVVYGAHAGVDALRMCASGR